MALPVAVLYCIATAVYLQMAHKPVRHMKKLGLYNLDCAIVLVSPEIAGHSDFSNESAYLCDNV